LEKLCEDAGSRFERFLGDPNEHKKGPGRHRQKLHAYALLISGLELSLRGVAGLILGAQGVPGGSPSPKKATKSEAGSFCMLARLEVIMPL
jgi:hypothetical protein